MSLGYACINMNLSELPKSKCVTTNRSMVKKTFKERGITYASELALQNCRDLLTILEWNEESDIKFFRLSESRSAEQKDEKIRVQAHSDYIYKPVDNYGVDYDMMLECKKKELGLLKYRAISDMEAQVNGSEEKAYC